LLQTAGARSAAREGACAPRIRATGNFGFQEAWWQKNDGQKNERIEMGAAPLLAGFPCFEKIRRSGVLFVLFLRFLACLCENECLGNHF
jgi:hypothetical protein